MISTEARNITNFYSKFHLKAPIFNKISIPDLRASSRASIQHLPAALVGARKMRWEVGSGWTTAPIVSPSGPRLAHTD